MFYIAKGVGLFVLCIILVSQDHCRCVRHATFRINGNDLRDRVDNFANDDYELARLCFDLIVRAISGVRPIYPNVFDLYGSTWVRDERFRSLPIVDNGL